MAKKAAPEASPTVVVPDPVIRTMIVCVPDELPPQVLSAGNLETHLGVSGTSCPRYWASPAVHPWQRRHLFDLRKSGNGPRYCAGGPIRLLDLAGMRHGAFVGASIRHAHWARVVAGTRHATPWPMYLQRHLTDPSTYPMDTAVADFNRQPRVQAMRMYNAAAYGTGLDLGELEMYQAGPAGYANYQALWALCGDALLTPSGERMQPASDHLADRITYLERATRYLDRLPDSQRLLAVNLHHT